MLGEYFRPILPEDHDDNSQQQYNCHTQDPYNDADISLRLLLNRFLNKIGITTKQMTGQININKYGVTAYSIFNIVRNLNKKNRIIYISKIT